MCQKKECRMICYYELNDEGDKVFIHYDDLLKPIWIELTKDGVSLGNFFPTK